MKLYHVSYRPIAAFYPKVPKHRLDTEDETPRICTATSLEDCILAKAGQDAFMNLCLEANLPCVVFLYEFEIDPNDPALIGPDELAEKHGVPDAAMTLEHWICDNRQPVHSEALRITNARYSPSGMLRIETTPAKEADMILPDLAQWLSEKTGRIIEPDNDFPQIWNEICRAASKRQDAAA